MPRDSFGIVRTPTTRHPPRALALRYGIAKRLLRVEAADERAADAAEQFLSGYHLERLPDGVVGRADACVVRAHTHQPAPRAPREWSSFDVAHGRCFSRGGVIFLDVCDSAVRVGAQARGVVEVWFGETERARSPVAVTNVWAYALQAALRRASLFDLHAACVVSPRGRGCVIAGTSGSGKSTLTLQLAARGWSYLTDDMTQLEERDGRVTARGLRRLFSLSEEAARACVVAGVSESLGTPVYSDPTKRRLDPSRVFPGAHAASFEPSSLWFPRVARVARSSVRELSTAGAMARLIRLCPWAGYDEAMAREYLSALAALARQCRAFELEAGEDLLASPARAEEIIGGGF